MGPIMTATNQELNRQTQTTHQATIPSGLSDVAYIDGGACAAAGAMSISKWHALVKDGNPWINVFGRLANQPGRLNLSVPVYNPRPAGVIRNVSATHSLLEFFQANPDRYFTHAEILWRTKCSKRAIDWGLIYLKSQRLICCAPGGGCNPRYLHYRFAGGNQVKTQVSEAPATKGASKSSAAHQISAKTQRLVKEA